MIAPLAIGSDAGDIAALNQRVQQDAASSRPPWIDHLRLSRALDIALWDIAGKAAGLPLHRLLGAAGDKSIPGYASLFRVRDAELVAERCRAATAQGLSMDQAARDCRARGGGGAPSSRRRCAYHGGYELSLDAGARPGATPSPSSPMAFTGWRSRYFPPEDFRLAGASAARYRHPSGGGGECLHVLRFPEHVRRRRRQLRATQCHQGGRSQRVPQSGGAGADPRRGGHAPLAVFRSGLPRVPAARRRVAGGRADRAACTWIWRRVFTAISSTRWTEVSACRYGPGLGMDPDPDVIESYRVRDP